MHTYTQKLHMQDVFMHTGMHMSMYVHTCTHMCMYLRASGTDMSHTYLECSTKSGMHKCISTCHNKSVLAVRYGTVRYGTVRYGTVRYGTVRYGTVRYGTVRYGTVRYGTVRYSTLNFLLIIQPLE